MKWLLIIAWLNGGDTGPHVDTVPFATEVACRNAANVLYQQATKFNADAAAFNANPPPANAAGVRTLFKPGVEVPAMQCVPQ